MIQMGTVMEVLDNSGARKVRCIKVLGVLQRRYGQSGEVCVASVQKINPRKKIKKGAVHYCLIGRCVSEKKRRGGDGVRFDRNGAILVNGRGMPLGTRILGAVSGNLRKRKYMKVVSIAKVTI